MPTADAARQTPARSRMPRSTDARFTEQVLGPLKRLEALYPAEQARILRLLIERVDVAPDGISVTLHAAGIRSLVAELTDHGAPALAAPAPVLEAAE